MILGASKDVFYLEGELSMAKILIKNSLIAIHPGRYLEDYMLEENLSTIQMAEKLKINRHTLIQLLNGRQDLSDNLIEHIASALGTSKKLWHNLDIFYQQKKQEIEKKP